MNGGPKVVRCAAVALLAAVAACASSAQTPGVTLTAENRLPKGWMPGGWGSYRFVLRNGTQEPATLVRWTAHWEAGGETVGDAWGGDLGQTLEAGKTVTRDEVGYLPEEVVAKAKPGVPSVAGTFTVKQGDSVKELSYRFEVAGAVLPEPLKQVNGKTVGLALMASRFKDFKHLGRTLKWVDECYQAMIDLTGERPFAGKRMVFKECPEHPWWAYAGQEMILNTKFVGETLKDFDDGLISFGWIHEVGHNFDVLGDWYIWSGPAAEWQANFKLAYAFENIKDQSFRIKWLHEAPGYPKPKGDLRLTGREMNESFFGVFGDEYLADPKRTYDTLSSDDMHTFFMRIQRCYGWEVFKRWYRTYRRLADQGQKPPEKPEQKISLIDAILSKEAGVDLTPVFQRWRFPVTAESVRAARELYGIAAP
jgi:hypothetical protein